MHQNDPIFIQAAIGLAQKARDHGNHPFGALLVDAEGNVLLEAENSVMTENDCTGHAELNLVRAASKKYTDQFLATCTLYTSTEPCPMCAGAIFWGNIRRVVFGLSEEGLYSLIDKADENILYLPCRDVFKHGQKPIEVVGPLLEDEAIKVHLGFWDSME
ncbi:MAG: nucleoside deaminase [Anaerolineae bacterium]